MTKIMNRVHAWEAGFDKKAVRFASHHPYLAYLAVFIGMPLFILGAVFLSTTVIMLPLALIFGWL